MCGITSLPLRHVSDLLHGRFDRLVTVRPHPLVRLVTVHLRRFPRLLTAPHRLSLPAARIPACAQPSTVSCPSCGSQETTKIVPQLPVRHSPATLCAPKFSFDGRLPIAFNLAGDYESGDVLAFAPDGANPELPRWIHLTVLLVRIEMACTFPRPSALGWANCNSAVGEPNSCHESLVRSTLLRLSNRGRVLRLGESLYRPKIDLL